MYVAPSCSVIFSLCFLIGFRISEIAYIYWLVSETITPTIINIGVNKIANKIVNISFSSSIKETLFIVMVPSAKETSAAMSGFLTPAIVMIHST